jgi:hypothetical protein
MCAQKEPDKVVHSNNGAQRSDQKEPKDTRPQPGGAHGCCIE